MTHLASMNSQLNEDLNNNDLPVSSSDPVHFSKRKKQPPCSQFHGIRTPISTFPFNRSNPITALEVLGHLHPRRYKFWIVQNIHYLSGSSPAQPFRPRSIEKIRDLEADLLSHHTRCSIVYPDFLSRAILNQRRSEIIRVKVRTYRSDGSHLHARKDESKQQSSERVGPESLSPVLGTQSVPKLSSPIRPGSFVIERFGIRYRAPIAAIKVDIENP